MKKILAVLLLVISFLSFSFPSSASTEENVFYDSINEQRSLKGLDSLTINQELATLAVQWSQQMAASGRISHSDLVTGAPENWKKLGENVGMGGSASSIANAFIASPSHLQNILEPSFNTIGVGITNSNGILFVTQKFMQTTTEVVSKPVPTVPPIIPSTIPPTTTTPPVTTTEPITIEPTSPKVVSPIDNGSLIKKLKQSFRKLLIWIRSLF